MPKKGSGEWPPQPKYPNATQDVKQNIELRHDGNPSIGITFKDTENNLQAGEGAVGVKEASLAKETNPPFTHTGDLIKKEAVLAKLYENTLPLSSLQALGSVEDVRSSPENLSSRLGVTFENIATVPEVYPEQEEVAEKNEAGNSLDHGTEREDSSHNTTKSAHTGNHGTHHHEHAGGHGHGGPGPRPAFKLLNPISWFANGVWLLKAGFALLKRTVFNKDWLGKLFAGVIGTGIHLGAHAVEHAPEFDLGNGLDSGGGGGGKKKAPAHH